MIIETFRQALQNVWSNKLRTFLTMLGIIIGVMAVIVIVGLGNGMTQSMRDSFSALGTNALSIQVWGYGSRTASVEDVYKIADKNKELISAVSPQIDFSNNTPKVGTTTYRYGTSVYGVGVGRVQGAGAAQGVGDIPHFRAGFQIAGVHGCGAGALWLEQKHTARDHHTDHRHEPFPVLLQKQHRGLGCLCRRRFRTRVLRAVLLLIPDHHVPPIRFRPAEGRPVRFLSYV